MEQNKSSQSLRATRPVAIPSQDAEFDQYAEEYGKQLKGLSLTGESKEYFARMRVAWLLAHLTRLSAPSASVLDFGCGTGSSTPFFLDVLHAERVIGVDVSARSLELARQEYGSEQSTFMLLDDYQPNGQIDVAFCNGVFHHILPHDRAGAVNYVYRSLRPGGIFAFWENNPWNPLTRYGMRITPLDHDAITITPPEARKLLGSGNFDIMRTDFLFIFPKLLNWLRWIEPIVCGLPIGGQYLVLCRKPNI